MSEKNFKLAISNEDLIEAFFENTRVLGIVAPVKDYQFCWQLNKMLGIDFRVNTEIEIWLQKKKRDYYFTVFEYKEPNRQLTHYLYNTQNEGEYLLPELKHFDFLWLMKDDELTNEEFHQTIALIRSIAGIQLVTALSNEKIKNKENLIF